MEIQVADAGGGCFEPPRDKCRVGQSNSFVARVDAARIVYTGGAFHEPLTPNTERRTEVVVRGRDGVTAIPDVNTRYGGILASPIAEQQFGFDFNRDGKTDSNTPLENIIFFEPPSSPLNISYDEDFADKVVIASDLPDEYFGFYLVDDSSIDFPSHIVGRVKVWRIIAQAPERNKFQKEINKRIENVSILRGMDSNGITCWTLSPVNQ